MELELHIVEVETERRWNWLEFFNANVEGTVYGRFLSYRDDETFAWLQSPDTRLDLTHAPRRVKEVTRRLRPAYGSTITSIDELPRISASDLVEIRQYRLRSGTRERFAKFLHDRTLTEHKRLGMLVHGPFEVIDDADVLTWFRGFPDLAERDRRKAAFYQGRLWLDELEDEAFSMIESYEVILAMPV